MVGIVIFNASSLVMALNYAIYCIYIGDMDTTTWNLPFNMVVPFNMETLGGWLLGWLLQLSINLSYTLGISISTMNFAGFCHYIVAICNHFEVLIDAIRLDVEQMKDGVMEKLFQLIDHHVNALEYVAYLADFCLA